MIEWQTMDSAPKDGTYFLAYGSYHYPGDFSGTHYMEVAMYSGDEQWPWEDAEGMHCTTFFSHWQPLPAPPAALT